MFSLSHWGIVAIVIAAVVAIWKVDRKKSPVRPSARDQSRTMQRDLLKLAILIALVLGSLAPAMGLEIGEYAHYIDLACTTGLAVLAYLWLFTRRK